MSAASPAVQTSSDSEYIIDSIFPARELHIISGPRGAGKTTLLFQIIDDWQAGRQVFGYHSHPAPFCYVSCDRSHASIRRTRARVRSADSVPTLSLVEGHIEPEMHAIIEAARALVPHCRVLFIDALAMLCPGGKINDYAVVGHFLTDSVRLLQSEALTVVGILHSGKVREGELIHDPAQRILGSVAWGNFSETIVHIEPVTPECPSDNGRTIYLLPRNAPAQALDWAFDRQSGRLVPRECPASAAGIFEAAMLALPLNLDTTTAQALELAKQCEVSRTAAEYVLTNLVRIGKLERPKKGVYRRV